MAVLELQKMVGEPNDCDSNPEAVYFLEFKSLWVHKW